MRLSTIYEADISRRDFLKKTTAGALSASPLGKLMLGVGMQPEVVKSVLGGKLIPFIVNTATHYGHGHIPDMSEQFSNVSQAANFVKRFSSFLGFGTDEDSYFTGRMELKDFAKIIKALKNDDIIYVDGVKYGVYDDDKYITLEDAMGGIHIRIYKSELPKYLNEKPVTENPLKAWWDGYGAFGNEIIDVAAKEIMDELGLKRENDIDFEDGERWDQEEKGGEDSEEDMELDPKERDEQFRTSMHQPFSYEQLIRDCDKLIHENNYMRHLAQARSLSPMDQAATEGDLESFKYYLSQEMKPRKSGMYRQALGEVGRSNSTLSFAALGGNPELFILALKARMQPNGNVLSSAVNSGNPEILEIALKVGITPGREFEPAINLIRKRIRGEPLAYDKEEETDPKLGIAFRDILLKYYPKLKSELFRGYSSRGDTHLDEGLKDWTQKLALGGAILGGSLGAVGCQSDQPNMDQSTSAYETQSGSDELRDGLNKLHDNRTYVYIADKPKNSNNRINIGLTKSIVMKAKEAYVQETGSNMQGIEWGTKEIGDKIGVWFR